ncbi:Sterol uptake control protein-like protein [Hapsidospora chrysogenum ATCC 11550]|uniref:Sterol uptake control protein-like protein n=1 Tax=Hapsidospora chrysogenum (strain ATCC 11550 / CBS 779.69 / DSM 880 / IAM 14645 / JCM 23072 / IMI 49137) TaxID=857340 RepID=A0A086SYE5_HAPC1|nr:Sterol uptake control protein-like protein [Hapsidospora chrysogenum ATCC 11550]
MPRLGFSKSRNGCLKCKQRRVKCDERRPACSACVRHGVPCSLGGSPAPPGTPTGSVSSGSRRTTGARVGRSSQPSPVSSPGTTTSNATGSPLAASGEDDDHHHHHHQHHHHHHRHHHHHPFSYLSNLLKTPETPGAETWWTSDLELMHHYTAVACKTLPRADTEPRVAAIWQLELPRLAVTHDFLMHQLLAISAVHMSRVYAVPWPPSEDGGTGAPTSSSASTYAIRATQHQNRAIQQLQSALPAITDANCAAVFLTASLLSISEFAALAAPTPGRCRPGIDDLLRVFLLVRGMQGILKSQLEAIVRSPIGHLLHLGSRGSDDSDGASSSSPSPLLDSITEELGRLMDEPSPPGPVPETATGVHEGAASLLRWIEYAQATGGGLAEFRVIMAWGTDLTEGFTGLLRRREGHALRVLDCYGRILEALGSRFWFLEGWGRCVRDDIHKACSW